MIRSTQSAMASTAAMTVHTDTATSRKPTSLRMVAVLVTKEGVGTNNNLRVASCLRDVSLRHDARCWLRRSGVEVAAPPAERSRLIRLDWAKNAPDCR